jgi:hypothetical protein
VTTARAVAVAAVAADAADAAVIAGRTRIAMT